MPIKIVSLSLFATLLSLSFLAKSCDSKPKENPTQTAIKKDSLLRHVVLFKFRDSTSQADIDNVQKAFSALPSKIPQIAGYEWGTNNSPEGLNKGLTHCFFLTFKSEADRATYLPHPDHKAFGEILIPHLDDVTVVDYWTY
jgi:hypothetical protein